MNQINQIGPLALFRLSVLGPMVSCERLDRGELRQLIRELAQREYAIPGSERRHIGEKTIEAWYYAWRRLGLAGLAPKARVDRGQSRLSAPIQQAVLALALDISQPQQALTDLIRFVWRYYQQHPEFITLLNTENLLRGQHIAKSAKAREYSSPVIAITDSVLKSGVALSLFRADLSARDVYLMIASMAYFYLGNRYTLSSFLGEDLQAPAALAHWEGFVVDAVQRTVAQPVPPVSPAA